MSVGIIVNNFDYFPHIILWGIIWYVLQVLSDLFFSRVFVGIYSQLAPIKQRQLGVRAVAFINALIVCTLAFQIVMDQDLQENTVFGSSEIAAHTLALACGYFLWDFAICLYYYQEYGFGLLVHGFVCFFVYFFTLRPLLQYYGSVFLLFEISTIFLNLNGFLEAFGASGTLLHAINGILLIVSFFIFRLVFGYYSSFHFFLDVWRNSKEIPIFLIAFYYTANVILNGLNVFWFWKMIKKALRKKDPKTKKN